MYAAEVLSQLRSLNHLCREVHSLPQTSPEVVLLEKQIAELRARLPNSILAYHDRLAARGRPSAIRIEGESCSACHLRLPRGLVGELAVAGRFGVCPNCGVFLWKGEMSPEPAAMTPGPKKERRVAAKVGV